MDIHWNCMLISSSLLATYVPARLVHLSTLSHIAVVDWPFHAAMKHFVHRTSLSVYEGSSSVTGYHNFIITWATRISSRKTTAWWERNKRFKRKKWNQFNVVTLSFSLKKAILLASTFNLLQNCRCTSSNFSQLLPSEASWRIWWTQLRKMS